MPWIRVIDENEATGQLKEIYEKLKKKRGKIANILKIHSLNPDAMLAHMELYITLMFGKSGPTREERELIAVVVSTTNNCEYCVRHHSEALNHYWKDNERIQRLIKDFRSIELSTKSRGMLEYVVKLTENPDKITKKDIDALLKCGFTNEDILDINLIVSYFNFVNRVALGLGVEFTEEEVSGYKV